MISTGTKRAVIYARYSSDNQRDASIDDQVRVCTAYIERHGFERGANYSDHAFSAASALRPGYQKLIEDGRTGRYDVVVAESLDRLSRDQSDIAALYKLFAYLGIQIVTVADGEINELHVGLKGTMNALFLKDLAQKTRRGLEGRVRQGRSGGGICYGYDLVPGDTGARRINAAEAEIVRRIFRDFAAGKSPRAIARQLNMESVPGPHGREWRDTAIRGHVTRGTGILNNRLYVGQLIWNRLTYVKDPASGRRRSRLNPEDQHICKPVPELRIIDDALWSTVRERQSGIRNSEPVSRAREKRFWEKRRPAHFLTGLVRCGACGGGFASVGRDYLACSAARGRGTCSNTKSLRRGTLEDLILSGLQHRLMAPELVDIFITEVNLEMNRQRREDEANRAVQERELTQVGRKLAGLVEAIADGIRAPDLQHRLDELTAKREELVRSLEKPAESAIRLHPNLGQMYRRKVEGLQAALRDPAIRGEAVEIVRSLLDCVIIHAGADGPEVEIVGELARMVELGLENRNAKQAALDERTAYSVKVVAGTGFEPVTFRL